ncbi:MAG: family 78 glycoside hydrolase catalytic domain [Acidobacteria bacterium]|nr:family 78 glycoside hydrolase catalytic domain [Acidobacteriota bacterium]
MSYRHLIPYIPFVLAICLSAGPKASAQQDALTVTRLRCEYKTDPIGLDVLKPRLSWQIQAPDRGVVQAAYQIRAAASAEDLRAGRRLLWDSGEVRSDSSIHVVYGGPALKSRQRVFWQVRVKDRKGRTSPWSEAAFWEMGLLEPSDWTARWIQPDLQEDTKQSQPSPMLRREFALRKPVREARAYITALGLYEAELNGRKIGNELFTPGWTSYDHHIQYQTYDVTPLLRQGANAVGVTLGDGWYRGWLGFGGQRNTYGERLALLLEIRVTYQDGTSESIATDAGWKTAVGPILKSDIYNGETYDARLEKTGWSRAGFDDSSWKPVRVVDPPRARLVAPAGPPVLRIQEITPVRVFKTPAGDTVLDMGQNMVGWVQMKVQGPAGAKVTLRHAEVLDKEGNFYTENLRVAKQTDEYTLKGQGEEVFEPHFTFHGFRFVAVAGYPDEVTPGRFKGIVIHSDITPAGTLECSEPMINQLQHNIQWGQKGNFLDVPTDCPQRDERLGWTGDAQVFAPTACFNADVAAFYTKWLKDVAADQKPTGAVPHVIPNVLQRLNPTANSASAGWADAAVIVPWTVHLAYGDTRILEQQYPSMKAWIDYMAGKAGDSFFWNQDFTFGDWLAFATTRSDYPGATTDKDLIMQAYFARSTDVLRQAAIALGKTEDAVRYSELLSKIKKVFNEEFVTQNGRLSSNTQTAYALALGFGLLPENLRARAAERLAADVRRFKHITTGFLGAPLMCPVLTDWGYLDEAYMLLLRKEYPSWLYPITKGATTIWERWDGLKPDGTFQDKGMNSFNHYAYGAIGDWLYRVVAGLSIDSEKPGYKHVRIWPRPGGGLTFARASHQSMYGPVSSGWEIRDGRFRLDVEVPPNASATVWLPGAKAAEVTESGIPISTAAGVQRVAQEREAVIVEIGSGRYSFSCPWAK